MDLREILGLKPTGSSNKFNIWNDREQYEFKDEF